MTENRRRSLHFPVYPGKITAVKVASKEIKPKCDYYRYWENAKLREAALQRKIKELEQQRRISLNRIQDRIYQIKEELIKSDIEKKTSSKDRRKGLGIRRKEDGSYVCESHSRELPPLNPPPMARLGSKFSLMSKKEKTFINTQSFERLKAKYSVVQAPRETVYSTLLYDPGDVLQYIIGRCRNNDAPVTGSVSGLTSSNNYRVSPDQDTLCSESTLRGDDPEASSWPITETAAGDSVPSSDMTRCGSSADCKAYFQVMNTLAQLPRISGQQANHSQVTSGTSRDPEVDAEGTAEEDDAKRYITIDDVKCCRYIRGYEPCYMRMPEDVNRFVFNESLSTESSTNDVLE